MRVLHVIPSLDPCDGGPSIALPLMARSLAMQGMEVDVVATMSAEDAREQGVRFGEPLQREGFTVRFFRRQTRFYKASLPLLRWLRAHVKDYALVHNHALFSFAPLAGAWSARKSGVPYVMRPLGLLNTWGMENRRRWIKALSFRWLDRPALDGAAAIHYTSPGEEREAARLGLRARSVVIPLGIDLTPFQHLPDPELFLERFPHARGRQIILFLSRLDPKKGIEVLLEALTRLEPRESSPIKPNQTQSNPILVIAGSGDPAYVATLKERAMELNLEEDVVWAGFLDGKAKLAAFAAADLYVLPSYSENFGIALLEAMAAGLPCMSTDQVALAVEAGDAVRRVSLEAALWAEAICEVLADTSGRSRLAHSAQRYSKLHSLERMGSALSNLYNIAE